MPMFLVKIRIRHEDYSMELDDGTVLTRSCPIIRFYDTEESIDDADEEGAKAQVRQRHPLAEVVMISADRIV